MSRHEQHIMPAELTSSIRASRQCQRHFSCVSQTVLGIILGGGAGSRLYPLTKKRAKPAVPLGANYRLIDIPVSNCINSNINKIYCLTQFNSASLNRHLSQAYNANVGSYSSRGFVEVSLLFRALGPPEMGMKICQCRSCDLKSVLPQRCADAGACCKSDPGQERVVSRHSRRSTAVPLAL